MVDIYNLTTTKINWSSLGSPVDREPRIIKLTSNVEISRSAIANNVKISQITIKPNSSQGK